jgi:Icc-related predicted phosphoesterase
MKISFISDLHLEFQNYPHSFGKEQGGDILILAGDITSAGLWIHNRTDPEARSQRKFFEKYITPLSKQYDKTFMVMGNHEHYKSNFQETKGVLDAGFDSIGLDITVFDNNSFDYNGWTFIGCTLWSDFNNHNPIAMENARLGMNDYRLIGVETGPWNRTSFPIYPQFTYEKHQQSRAYIDAISANKDNVFVFTHMAPSFKSLNTEHCGNGLDYAYASDMSEFILDRPQIKYWVHGHTHMSVDYMIGDCRVLSNQRGYYGEKCYFEYKGLAHIEV